MAWGAIVGSVIGAGLDFIGGSKNAKENESAAARAAEFQNRALDTSVALSRPQLEVGNQALGLLAGIFGLDPPDPIDFNAISGGRSTFTPGGGLNRDQQSAVEAFTQTFGFDPIANPEQAIGIDQRNLPSDRLRDRLNNFTSTFGFDPTRREGNPFFEPQQQQGAAQGGGGLDLSSLITNNPGVQFAQQEDERATRNALAAAGLSGSGFGVDEFGRRASGRAATNFQSLVLNPLFQLAGFGPQAGAQINQANQATQGNLGNLALGAGDARGSAFQNGFNSLGNVARDIGGLSLINSRRNNLNNAISNANNAGAFPPIF